MASLSIVAEGQEQKHALGAPSVTLGRGLECGIRLKDVKSSRQHCQIIKSAAGYECVDLKSGNGTFINGVQISRQVLRPGDKIQIGTTVIIFQDAPAAPAASPAPGTTKTSARPGTQKIPVASATRKVATGTVATQKATVRVPQADGAATSATQKATSRFGRGTTRRGGTTRGTAFVSGTQSFYAESKKKKASPVAIIIGGIAVLFLVAVGVIVFGGGEDESVLTAQLRNLEEQAAKAWGDGDYATATAKYKEALSLIDGKDKYRTKAIDYRGKLGEIEGEQAKLAAARRTFDEFKDKFDRNLAPPKQLWDECNTLVRAYENADVPWLADLKKMRETLDRMIETDIQTRKRTEFQVVRAEITEKHKLDDRTGKANWSGAIQDYREFLGKNPTLSDDTKNKVNNEILNINSRAHEEVNTLGKRAKRAVEENRAAEAVEDLKKQKPRFENTESRDPLEQLIQEIGK